MKTTKLPYFIWISRRFIFRSQKYFLLSSSPPTAIMTSWLRHFSRLQVEVGYGSLKYFWDRKTAFKEAKHDKSSFGRLNWTRFCRVIMVCSSTIAKFESTLYSTVQGGIDPNKISGVGTMVCLLVHVLPGPNKRFLLEPSTFKSWIRGKIISPTHKRTEGRAPVSGSEFTSKDAALQGGGSSRNRC